MGCDELSDAVGRDLEVLREVLHRRPQVVLVGECFRFTKRFCFTSPEATFCFTKSGEELHCRAEVILEARATLQNAERFHFIKREDLFVFAKHGKWKMLCAPYHWHTLGTKGLSWGYPVLVLGAISSFLSTFGENRPRFLNNLSKLTFEYPHEGPCVGSTDSVGPRDETRSGSRVVAGMAVVIGPCRGLFSVECRVSSAECLQSSIECQVSSVECRVSRV